MLSKESENPNPFNVDAAIQQWRSRLEASSACSSEALGEIEAHLRDSIVALRENGLSEDEAFLIACRRLGHPSELETEFAKVEGAALVTPRIGWMIAGIGLYLALTGLGRVASAATMLLGNGFVQSGIGLGFAALAVHVLTLTAAVIALVYVFGRPQRRIQEWVVRALRRPLLVATASALLLVGLRASETLLLSAFTLKTAPSRLGPAWFVSGVYGRAVPVLLLIALGIVGFQILRKGSRVRYSHALLVPLFLSLMISTGCDRAGSAAAEASSETAPAKRTAFEQSLDLWTAGNETEAVTRFLAIDWAREQPFSTGSVLAYTEPQFVALPRDVREKLSPQLLDGLEKIKALCRRVKEDGDKLRVAGDVEAAKRSFEQLAKCGDALNRSDRLLIAQMVGQAVQRLASR